MPTVRIVTETGTGPTPLASYDAALGACGLGDYNLVPVSSVLPADATIEICDSVPDLGPVGGVVTVVQAKTTVKGPGEGAAAIAWATAPTGGIIYEASITDATDATPQTTAETQVETGIKAGMAQREWVFAPPSIESTCVSLDTQTYGSAVAVAVFGDAESVS